MDIYSCNGCTKLLPLLHSHILTDINVYCDWVVDTNEDNFTDYC